MYITVNVYYNCCIYNNNFIYIRYNKQQAQYFIYHLFIDNYLINQINIICECILQ